MLKCSCYVGSESGLKGCHTSPKLYLSNTRDRNGDTLIGVDHLGLQNQGHGVELQPLDLLKRGYDDCTTPHKQGGRLMKQPGNDEGLVWPSGHNLHFETHFFRDFFFLFKTIADKKNSSLPIWSNLMFCYTFNFLHTKQDIYFEALPLTVTDFTYKQNTSRGDLAARRCNIFPPNFRYCNRSKCLRLQDSLQTV